MVSLSKLLRKESSERLRFWLLLMMILLSFSLTFCNCFYLSLTFLISISSHLTLSYRAYREGSLTSRSVLSERSMGYELGLESRDISLRYSIYDIIVRIISRSMES